jgi:hypothetical protein
MDANFAVFPPYPAALAGFSSRKILAGKNLSSAIVHKKGLAQNRQDERDMVNRTEWRTNHPAPLPGGGGLRWLQRLLGKWAFGGSSLPRGGKSSVEQKPQ